MMRSIKIAALCALSLFFLVAISGCTGSNDQWSMTVNENRGMSINAPLYHDLINTSITVDNFTGIPLEMFLDNYGLYPLASVSFDGRTYNWSDVAYNAELDLPFLVLPNGSIYDGMSISRADNIDVVLTEKPNHTTLEITPSILYALGAGGEEDLIKQKSKRVVVFYIDGMGYKRYSQARALGLIDNISAMGEPIKALDQYPSISQVNAIALVTGQPSDLRAGGFRNAYPSGSTVLDLVSEKGMTAEWVGGKTSPVNLGDRMDLVRNFNDNGYEADEVATEAIWDYGDDVNLLFVHFKDTDTKQHLSGPFSDTGMASMEYVDQQFGRVINNLAPGTIVVVFADHGGHNTVAGGNHGTLLPEDMVVPIIVHTI